MMEELLIKLYEDIKGTLHELKIAKSTDKNGLNSILAGNYIRLANLYMLIKGDEEKFCFYINIAADIYVDLAQKKMKGEDVMDFIFLPSNYIINLLFLAGRCIKEVEDYSKILWIHYREIHINSTDYHFLGILIIHTLYRLILNECEIEESIKEFYAYCEHPVAEQWMIFVIKMIDGIHKKDGILIESGLDDVIAYKELIKQTSMDPSGNKDFCYWAIGLCNLAISRGISFKFPKDEYLPHKLLMTPNKVELKEVIKEKKPKKEKLKT